MISPCCITYIGSLSEGKIKDSLPSDFAKNNFFSALLKCSIIRVQLPVEKLVTIDHNVVIPQKGPFLSSTNNRFLCASDNSIAVLSVTFQKSNYVKVRRMKKN